MQRAATPALAPAAAFLVGTALAPRLGHLPVPGLVLFVCLTLALRVRWGDVLAMLGLALLNGAVFWVLPAREAPTIVLERPVTAQLALTTSFTARRLGDEVIGWWGWGELDWLRQGKTVSNEPRQLRLFLPGGDPPPAAGRLLVRGYLGRSQGYANQGPPRPGPWRLSIKSRRFVAVSEVGALGRFLALRDRVLAPLLALRSTAPCGHGDCGHAVVRALVLGDRSAIPIPWQIGLRRWGLSHLLAVSGLHVALVVAPVVLLVPRRPRGLAVALALTAIAAYLLLVGPRPAVLRSSVMAALLLSSPLAARPPQALNALALAVGGLLLHQPRLIEDLGFQLTVSATAGILLLASSWAATWTAVPGWCRTGLAVSVAAQLASWPWALPAFAAVSPLSPLLNLVAVPWTGICLFVALPVLPLSHVSSRCAELLLALVDVLALPFAAPGHLLGPETPIGWAAVSLHVGWGGAAAAAVAIGWPLHRCRAFVALLATVLAWSVLQPRLDGEASETPELVMLDVGQGDSLLLRQGRAAILVDGGGYRGGGDFAGRVLLPALTARGITRLRAAVLTHPDRDHCGGLEDISRYLPIEELWLSPGWSEDGCAGRVAALHSGRLRYLQAGDQRHAAGWTLEVLHPDVGQVRGVGSNAHSLVLRASSGRWSVLLTGDIDSRVEAELAARYPGLVHSDVLKLAHHGSRSSTSPRFLAQVRPRLALVSAGRDNPYGHPSGVVQERLAHRRIPLLRTDRQGAVTLALPANGPWRLHTHGRAGSPD